MRSRVVVVLRVGLTVGLRVLRRGRVLLRAVGAGDRELRERLDSLAARIVCTVESSGMSDKRARVD